MRNQGVTGGLPTAESAISLPRSAAVDQLYRLADDVRRIGTRRGSTPFDLLADKEAAADRLVDLARRLETAR